MLELFREVLALSIVFRYILSLSDTDRHFLSRFHAFQNLPARVVAFQLSSLFAALSLSFYLSLFSSLSAYFCQIQFLSFGRLNFTTSWGLNSLNFKAPVSLLHVPWKLICLRGTLTLRDVCQNLCNNGPTSDTVTPLCHLQRVNEVLLSSDGAA